MGRRGQAFAKRGDKTGFVQLHEFMQRTEAWQDLGTAPRALYIELKRIYNGSNNGSITLGCRKAGQSLNIGSSVAHRAFQSLEQHGFISRRIDSSFNQKRIAIQWLLTEARNDHSGAQATKEFIRWRREKQKPVPLAAPIVPPKGQNDEIAHSK